MKHFLLICLFLTSTAFGQKTKTPKSVSKTPETLALYLTKDIRSKEKQVEKIHKWITENIAYDYDALERGTYTILPNPKQILKSRKALNSGYALLMQSMLDVLKIENETIPGYMHDNHWFPGKQVSEEEHMWIAVKLNDEWKFADPTWDSGYIGRIPKKEKEYKPKKYLKNNWKKESTKEKKLAKREKKEEERKTKFDDKPTYTNKIGFVSDPTKQYFLIHRDSFLMQHAPTLPMWQLRKSAITLKSYSKAQDSLLFDIENNIGIESNFEKEIEDFQKLDFLLQQLYHGEKGYAYNPHNPMIKASYYYDFMAIVHNKDLQKLARGSIYEINESKYGILSAFADTILKYGKLYKPYEKSNYADNKKFDKDRFKVSVERDKKNEKSINQLKSSYEKTIEKVKSNSKMQDKNLEKIQKSAGKLAADFPKSVDYQLPEDIDTTLIQIYIDSLRLVEREMNKKLETLNSLRENSSCNRLLSEIDYLRKLLVYNEHYIRVNSYSTEEWVAEVDSLIQVQSANSLQILQDSLPQEMVEKDLMEDLKKMEEICKSANAKLPQVVAKFPVKYELYLRNIQYNALNQVDLATRKNINFDQIIYQALKSEKGTINQINSRIKKQPDLKEKSYEYIAKLTEKEHERNENFAEDLLENAKKWKEKYSKK